MTLINKIMETIEFDDILADRKFDDDLFVSFLRVPFFGTKILVTNEKLTPGEYRNWIHNECYENLSTKSFLMKKTFPQSKIEELLEWMLEIVAEAQKNNERLNLIDLVMKG